jgi:hypothetical protein
VQTTAEMIIDPTLADPLERVLHRASASLLAIDIDIYEQPIHHRRRCVVLEDFARHHVAAVTGRIADRE